MKTALPLKNSWLCTCEKLLFISRYFRKASNVSETLHFHESHFFKIGTSSGQVNFRRSFFFFFRKAVVSSTFLFRKATFSEWLLSRKSSFLLQHNFSEVVFFYSFGFFSQLHFSFISYLLREFNTSYVYCRSSLL